MFIMVDGIDGSGKSTSIETWKKIFLASGKKVFDLPAFWKEKNRYPHLEEVESYDCIFSAEPTSTGVGRVIREELIAAGSSYPLEALAEAYSLDRLILYTKLIIPLLRSGRTIIQDRGISTSLSYQTAAGMPFRQLITLPGNQLALEHRPDHLVLLDVDPKVALERLAKRTEKQDKAIFERLDFLKLSSAQFHSAQFQKTFTERGTQLHYLPADVELAILEQSALDLLKTILTI